MKIALISPRGPLYSHKNGVWSKSLRYMPLTLTTLAALIPKELEAEVKLYDEGISDVPLDLDADLIGISAITGSSPRSYELADHYRKQGKKVVLGGVHPTLMPKEAAQHADSVVVGYAEQTWPQLLRDFKDGRLRKVYKNEKVDLRNIPFARRDLLPKARYLTSNTIEATRGCAKKCEFCVVHAAWGSVQHQRPVEDVIAEIRHMGAREMMFLDLNLISDEEYAIKLFKAMIPLKIKWFGLSTVEIAWNQKLLDLCAQSGCNGLLLGFETFGDDALLKTYKGFNHNKDYHFAAEQLHKKGIAIMACFVFGLDGDDRDVFEKTVQFCQDAKIDLPRFAISTPFPGTMLYKRLKKEGRILTEDWSLYDAQHVVFQPEKMTVKELYDGTNKAWRDTYSYSSIWKRLSKNRIHTLRFLSANLGYRLYAHNLERFYNCDVMRP